jgi:AraC-like DNA-binding protein
VDSASFRMTTDAIPTRDRAAVAREVFGRQFMRVELEPIGDTPLHVDLKLRALPGLRIIRGEVRGIRSSRTGALMADGNDDIFLTLNQTGAFRIFQRRYDVRLEAGDAQISGCGERFTYERPSGTALGLSIPHAALATRVRQLDDRLGSKLTRGNPALGLLSNYIGILDDLPGDAPLAGLAVSHIYDLVALSLGAKAGTDIEGQRISVNAARFHAVKAYIAAHLTEADLSVGQIALWQRITPRQLQRLFERAGTTFSAYLLSQRLARAHAALRDSRHSHQTISTIIFSCGFSDVSNFNHAFRRRYGETPSDVRNLGRLNN